MTMMDQIYEYMIATDGITTYELYIFIKLVQIEEYDTDSLFYDVIDGNMTIKSSNILSILSTQSHSKTFQETLCRYVQFKKGILSTLCYFLLSLYIYIQSEVVRLAVVSHFFIGHIIKIKIECMVHTKAQNYLLKVVNMRI